MNRSKDSLTGSPGRWWPAAGAALLVLSAAMPPVTGRAGPAGKTPPHGFRGMTLQLHSGDPRMPFETYVEEIARTGANTICLALAGYQENCAASSVFIEQRKAPSPERLEKIIKLARKRKLRVVLMPILLLENPSAEEWRGKIKPAKPDAWWEDYESFILFYARAAQKTGVEMFFVGSELVSLEAETDRWRELIAKVREAYKGKLSYSANWDHYRPIKWWRELDLIGMTSYYDLVGKAKPTPKVLLESWRRIKKEILQWRRTVGMPIIFTEVGWPSQVGCAKEPWNYYASTTPDPATQAMCFQAFFKTWRDEPTVAGTLIWEWRNHPGQVGGEKDISYVPVGKPAMKHIRAYFRRPDPRDPRKRPTASRPAVRSRTRPAP